MQNAGVAGFRLFISGIPSHTQASKKLKAQTQVNKQFSARV
jgi:hypothetical protein